MSKKIISVAVLSLGFVGIANELLLAQEPCDPASKSAGNNLDDQCGGCAGPDVSGGSCTVTVYNYNALCTCGGANNSYCVTAVNEWGIPLLYRGEMTTFTGLCLSGECSLPMVTYHGPSLTGGFFTFDCGTGITGS